MKLSVMREICKTTLSLERRPRQPMGYGRGRSTAALKTSVVTDGLIGPSELLTRRVSPAQRPDTITLMLISGTKTYQVEPDITVFEVYGRLNTGDLLKSVEHSMHSLISSGVRKLLVDLTGLTSIDSSGIGMLVSCGGQMDQVGGQMRLAGAQGSVAKVFEIVHMQRILPLDPDLASACGSFSSGAATA